MIFHDKCPMMFFVYHLIIFEPVNLYQRMNYLSFLVCDNDGMFDASKGTATLAADAGFNPAILSANGVTVDTAFADQPLADDGSRRSLTMCVTGFSETGAGRLTGPDGNEMDTEAFLASLHITNGGSPIVAGDGSGNNGGRGYK